MKNSIVIAAMVGSVFSNTALAGPSEACRSLPALKKNVYIAKSNAYAQKNYADAILEISDDAKALANKSAGLAIASGALGFGASALAMSQIGVVGGMAEKGIGFIIGFKAGMIAAVGGGVATTVADYVLVAGLISLVSPIDNYLVGRGLYTLILANGKKVEVNPEDLKLLEGGLVDLMKADDIKISQLLDNPPSKFENSIKFGSPMREHFVVIASLALRKQKAAEAILKIRSAELYQSTEDCANSR